MYIFIAADGRLSLRDSDNLRAFSIVEETSGSAEKSLAAIAIPATGQHYWLDANAVVELSGRMQDESWVRQLWDMLASVEAYGYSDMENKRVKAHVEQS
ncbi:MAG: hypothetical protein GY802_08820 [Gammaproteobacteria bacterium]|nr:hypothetical protein [Gammaproteobacteria bacterium]